MDRGILDPASHKTQPQPTDSPNDPGNVIYGQEYVEFAFHSHQKTHHGHELDTFNRIRRPNQSMSKKAKRNDCRSITPEGFQSADDNTPKDMEHQVGTDLGRVKGLNESCSDESWPVQFEDTMDRLAQFGYLYHVINANFQHSEPSIGIVFAHPDHIPILRRRVPVGMGSVHNHGQGRVGIISGPSSHDDVQELNRFTRLVSRYGKLATQTHSNRQLYSFEIRDENRVLREPPGKYLTRMLLAASNNFNDLIAQLNSISHLIEIEKESLQTTLNVHPDNATALRTAYHQIAPAIDALLTATDNAPKRPASKRRRSKIVLTNPQKLRLVGRIHPGQGDPGIVHPPQTNPDSFFPTATPTTLGYDDKRSLEPETVERATSVSPSPASTRTCSWVEAFFFEAVQGIIFFKDVKADVSVHKIAQSSMLLALGAELPDGHTWVSVIAKGEARKEKAKIRLLLLLLSQTDDFKLVGTLHQLRQVDTYATEVSAKKLVVDHMLNGDARRAALQQHIDRGR
ncbi:MAG: hypothetical protein Q9227_008158 [Pyrenula ochraceoflavens]